MNDLQERSDFWKFDFGNQNFPSLTTILLLLLTTTTHQTQCRLP